MTHTHRYPTYPVRIDQRMQVYSADGVLIGGPDLALAIIAGFMRQTPEAFAAGPEVQAGEVLGRVKRGRVG